jgi:hypothetical protein
MMMMNWLQSAYFGVVLISLSIQAIDMSKRASLIRVMCRNLSGLAASDSCLVTVADICTVQCSYAQIRIQRNISSGSTAIMIRKYYRQYANP